MVKLKGSRILVTLECSMCRLSKESNPFLALNKRKVGVSRYLTSKNRRNTTKKLELNKYCKYCDTKTIHKEIK